MMPFEWHVAIFITAVVFLLASFFLGKKVGWRQRDREWKQAINGGSKGEPL